MSEIKGNGESWNSLWREPLLREPDVRTKPESAAIERFVQRVDPWLEPRAVDREAQVLDAKPK
jgi:hypothetical protein